MVQLSICMQAKNWTATSLEPHSGMSLRGMREHLSRGQNFGLGGVPGQPLRVKRDLFEYVDGPMGVHIIEDQKIPTTEAQNNEVDRVAQAVDNNQLRR